MKPRIEGLLSIEEQSKQRVWIYEDFLNSLGGAVIEGMYRRIYKGEEPFGSRIGLENKIEENCIFEQGWGEFVLSLSGGFRICFYHASTLASVAVWIEKNKEENSVFSNWVKIDALDKRYSKKLWRSFIGKKVKTIDILRLPDNEKVIYKFGSKKKSARGVLFTLVDDRQFVFSFRMVGLPNSDTMLSRVDDLRKSDLDPIEVVRGRKVIKTLGASSSGVG